MLLWTAGGRACTAVTAVLFVPLVCTIFMLIKLLLNQFTETREARFYFMQHNKASLFLLCFRFPNGSNIMIPFSQLNREGITILHNTLRLTRRWRRGRTWRRPSCPALSAPPPASCCCTAAECFLHRTSPEPSWRWSRSSPAGLWCPLHPPENNTTIDFGFDPEPWHGHQSSRSLPH